MAHVKLVNLFVKKQVMLPANYRTLKVRFVCCKDVLFAKIT